MIGTPIPRDCTVQSTRPLSVWRARIGMTGGATEAATTGNTPACCTAAEYTVPGLTPLQEATAGFREALSSTGEAPNMPALAYGLCTTSYRICTGEVRGLAISCRAGTRLIRWSAPSFLGLVDCPTSNGPCGLTDRDVASTGAPGIRGAPDLDLLDGRIRLEGRDFKTEM
mmetsp:Transcript_98418/g.175279  ORF Transcript_98418/g.175279 Transcript_98418/m.175279 type:complete len:170 (+) Transcript_98418:242-751(+)